MQDNSHVPLSIGLQQFIKKRVESERPAADHQALPPTEIEAGYHFYNANEKEFDAKEYDKAKVGAVCYAAGKCAGRCELKEKVVKVFKPDRGEWA